jgi:TPR repeat protein
MYELAIKKGYNESLFNLANLYKSGALGKKDFSKFKDYIELGNVLGVQQCIASLSLIYLNGEGVEKDVDKG